MEVDTKKVFYDKLTYIYVEIPKFDKTEDQLVTMYDKWMFVLKNLSVLMERPAALQERVFTRLFEQAEVSKFNAQDRMLYEDSVNAYRDIINAINTAKKDSFAEGRAEGHAEGHAEGRAEGIAEGIEFSKVEIARKMLQRGMAAEEVAELTNMTVQDIKKIL